MENKYGSEQLASGSLSLTSCVTLLMGAMIGSAIFSLSGVTYAVSGPAHIITWVVAAAIMLVYGLVIAELASLYPVTGGLYVYPREIFGKTEGQKDFWGWFSAWAFLNPSIFGAAFAAIYVATYLGSVIPAVEPYVIICALVACVLCGILNIFKVSVAGKVNLILVAFMAIVMVIFAITGFANFDAANFTPFFTQGTGGAMGWVASVPNALLAYGAVAALVSMTSEIRNPNKTVPRAMTISITLTAVLYVLVVIATIGMMNVQVLLDDPHLQYYPLNAALDNALGGSPVISILVALAALMALITTMLVLIMAASRTIMAAAKAGFLPAFIGKVNPKTQTPVNAIIIITVITAALSCFPNFSKDIVGTGAFCKLVTIVIMVVTLLVARKHFPHQEGNYRMPGGAALPIFVVILIAFFVFLQDLRPVVLALIWFAVGFVIYGIFLAIKKAKTK